MIAEQSIYKDTEKTAQSYVSALSTNLSSSSWFRQPIPFHATLFPAHLAPAATTGPYKQGQKKAIHSKAVCK